MRKKEKKDEEEEEEKEKKRTEKNTTIRPPSETGWQKYLEGFLQGKFPPLYVRKSLASVAVQRPQVSTYKESHRRVKWPTSRHLQAKWGIESRKGRSSQVLEFNYWISGFGLRLDWIQVKKYPHDVLLVQGMQLDKRPSRHPPSQREPECLQRPQVRSLLRRAPRSSTTLTCSHWAPPPHPGPLLSRSSPDTSPGHVRWEEANSHLEGNLQPRKCPLASSPPPPPRPPPHWFPLGPPNSLFPRGIREERQTGRLT